MKALTEQQTRELNGGVYILKWYKAKCKICGYENGWTSEGACYYDIHYHIQAKHNKFWTTPYRKISIKREWHW